MRPTRHPVFTTIPVLSSGYSAKGFVNFQVEASPRKPFTPVTRFLNCRNKKMLHSDKVSDTDPMTFIAFYS